MSLDIYNPEGSGEYDGESEVEDDDLIPEIILDPQATAIPRTKEQNPYFSAPISLQTQKKTQETTVTSTSAFDLDIDALEEKPWRKPGVDITDYFNYGFTEDTWREYCHRQHSLRLGGAPGGIVTVANPSKITVYDGEISTPLNRKSSQKKLQHPQQQYQQTPQHQQYQQNSQHLQYQQNSQQSPQQQQYQQYQQYQQQFQQYPHQQGKNMQDKQRNYQRYPKNSNDDDTLIALAGNDMDEAKYRNNMQQYDSSSEQNYGGPRRNYQDQYGYQQQSRHMMQQSQSNAPRMYGGDAGRQPTQYNRPGRDHRESGDYSSHREDSTRLPDRDSKDLRREYTDDRKIKRERSDSGRDDRRRDR